MATSLTILVVQAPWLDRLRSTMAIRRVGAIAVTASTHAVAQRRLDTRSIDIALLDLDRHKEPPEPLLRRIQIDYPGVYCVAVSATLRDAELERWFARGFDDFLTRPLRVNRLRAVFDAAAEARSAALANRAIRFTNDADLYSQDLHAQLLVHLRDEADKLYTVLSGSSPMRQELRRKMHRIRSGLLLVGMRPLADECLDLERDCELDGVDDGVLYRRGWRIARQMRTLSAP